MAGRVPFDPFGAMLEGYRQADADNKQDLSFNAALEGAWLGNDAKHIQNLFNYDTYGIAAQMAQNQAMQSARNNAVGAAMHQGNIAAGNLSSLDKTGNYETAYNNLAGWLASKDTAFKSGISTADIQSYFAPKLAQQGGANSLYAANAFIPRDVANYDYDQQVRDASLAAMIQGIDRTPSGVPLGLLPAVANYDYDQQVRDASLADIIQGIDRTPSGVSLGRPPADAVKFGTQPFNWLVPSTNAGSTQPAVTTTGNVVGGTPQYPSTVRNSLGSSDTGVYAGGAGDYGMRSSFAPTTPRSAGSTPQNVPGQNGIWGDSYFNPVPPRK